MLLKTLKFQIPAALILLLLLFAGTVWYTLYATEQRRQDQILRNLAVKLQLTVELLGKQGQNYLANAPRDYTTYYRDVRLYYQDLMSHIATFDKVTNAFMMGSFPPELTGRRDMMSVALDEDALRVTAELEDIWADYRDGLMRALGEDAAEPRLEWAAEHIVNNQPALQKATDRLASASQRLELDHLEQLRILNRLILFFAGILTLGILAWFYLRVIRPLAVTATGFTRVSRGDFGHQLPARARDEIGILTLSFNQLSSRLNSVFLLIDKIQRGSDLDDTLRFVWEEFRTIVPIDWVGLLLFAPGGEHLELERAYTDGRTTKPGLRRIARNDSLLSSALETRQPLLVPDVAGEATARSALLPVLAGAGMVSTVLLPMRQEGTIMGILVIATRESDAYTGENLEFLSNIAQLVGHSLGRTVQLLEKERLAAIGEFASGIAHEIRNPLATISLAIDYFKKAEGASPSAAKRAELASTELHRLERLLEEILLYAKPMQLKLEALDLPGFVRAFIDEHRGLAEATGQWFTLDAPPDIPAVSADPDRLTQVLLNLARNACDAAPAGEAIEWSVTYKRRDRTVGLRLRNGGEPIPPELLPRLSKPFFTTKASGSGLGLSIIRRIVECHGGTVEIASDAKTGTVVTVRLPLAA